MTTLSTKSNLNEIEEKIPMLLKQETFDIPVLEANNENRMASLETKMNIKKNKNDNKLNISYSFIKPFKKIKERNHSISRSTIDSTSSHTTIDSDKSCIVQENKKYDVSHSVIYSGLLYKQEKINLGLFSYYSWKLRHCVLTRSHLKYYENENGKLIDAINLSKQEKIHQVDTHLNDKINHNDYMYPSLEIMPNMTSYNDLNINDENNHHNRKKSRKKRKNSFIGKNLINIDFDLDFNFGIDLGIKKTGVTIWNFVIKIPCKNKIKNKDLNNGDENYNFYCFAAPIESSLNEWVNRIHLALYLNNSKPIE